MKQHIVALYLNSRQSDLLIEEDLRDDKISFNEIASLDIGESLLFCPIAAVTVAGEEMGRMVGGYVKLKTRQRVTADWGKNKQT